MDEQDEAFLNESFKRYYFKHAGSIDVPPRAHEREFGYQKFGSGMVRHMSIRARKDLHLMLIRETPSDIYCSNSYYVFPEITPMDKKEWLGADMIFDIDAKDLKLPCRPDHTVRTCLECKNVSLDSETCKGCGSKACKKASLPCRRCMDAAGEQAIRLAGILSDDLGIGEDKIKTYFSGNEGFHMYAYDERFQSLAAKERMELAAYVMFKGAIPKAYGAEAKDSFPKYDDKGWRGRFVRYVAQKKSQYRSSKAIVGDQGAFQKKLDEASEAIGVRIDANVTTDVHRIFRMPESINSKSGLAKILCQDVSRFDPYTEAVLLDDDPVEVHADCPAGFVLKGTEFGPYASQKVTVPRYAAAYMICKGLAGMGPLPAHARPPASSA